MKKAYSALTLILILGVSASFAACNTDHKPAQTTVISNTQEVLPTAPTAGPTQAVVTLATSLPAASSTQAAKPEPTADSIIGNNKAKIVEYYNKAINLTNQKGKVSGKSKMILTSGKLFGKESSTLTNIASGLVKAMFKPESFTKLPPVNQKSSVIRPSDLLSANCTKNGDNYIIRLNAITETNITSKNSAHGRIFNVNDNLTNDITDNLNFYGDKEKDITKKYTGSTITAVVNSKTGMIQKLTSDIKVNLYMKNFSVSVFKVDERGASCTMTVHEDYTVS